MSSAAPTTCPEAEAAEAAFEAGASCAQAVLTGCCRLLGLSEKQAMQLGSGFGAGLCGLRETCGAVNAMVLALGLIKGADHPMEAKEKAALYRHFRSHVEAFDNVFGTHVCQELLKRASIQKQAGDAPEARSAAYYAKRPCAAFVRFCAERVAAAENEPAVGAPPGR
mgnify:FL=1